MCLSARDYWNEVRAKIKAEGELNEFLPSLRRRVKLGIFSKERFAGPSRTRRLDSLFLSQIGRISKICGRLESKRE